MTITFQSRRSASRPLKTYRVDLWPLEGMELTLKAANPSEARRIAARSFSGDDITEWFAADDDYWTIEELIGAA